MCTCDGYQTLTRYLSVGEASAGISITMEKEPEDVSGNGSSEVPLSMSYIKKRVLNELQIGDLIVTSGEGGNYIGDIPIGSISDIQVLDYDSSLSIKVTPIIDFSRIEMVIVSDRMELNPALIGKTK